MIMNQNVEDARMIFVLSCIIFITSDNKMDQRKQHVRHDTGQFSLFWPVVWLSNKVFFQVSLQGERNPS